MKISLIMFLAGSLFSQTMYGYKLPQPKENQTFSENVGILQKISKGLAEIADQSSTGVVFVSVSKTVQGMPMGFVDPFEFFFGNPRGPGGRPPRGGGEAPKQNGVGSGFIIDLEKGYIMTNNHVIEDADEIHVKVATGQTYGAKVLGRDKNTDVAVVQITDKNFKKDGLIAIPLGNSDEAKVGEFVIAQGAPFELEASLSFGTISAVKRTGLGIAQLESFIQTDAAINPGNSGGPLINMKGQVIGMNTAIYSRTGSSAGIGFAVPSNLARTVAEQLINEGKIKRGYVGIMMQPLTPELIKDFEMPESTQGVVVAKVEPNGPAAKAGLEPGDIIADVDGKSVRNQGEVASIIGLMPPGAKVKIGFFRDKKKKDLTLTIGQFPDQIASERDRFKDDGDKGGGSSDSFGLRLAPVNAESRQKFNLESRSGALITGIKIDSPADRAGFKAGDVIVQANRRKISSPEEFSKIARSEKRLLLRVERKGDFFYRSLRQ